ncbi:MAG TPA: 4-(cytidine 5'-diphospho)-2-C-methyl-D-erythritol kinase [Gemmatimonadaceae bacterium]|nr:4-(cytidine 5'-diphospho)-2-C-methyl-D-erythritol kinase [Gemmatimonadaceae bacterium]
MRAKVARVAAQAKLNLGLRILARERGGFHSIETLFARIALADTVTIRPRDEEQSLVVHGFETGPEKQNLAYRAACAYGDATGWPRGFEIGIEKRIPVGGGLGGGSADAGAVLRGLNALAVKPVSEAELLRIGITLGADVPFLTSTEPFALAWGHGERMLALPTLPERTVVLVLPGFTVSTADAYEWIAQARPTDVPSPRLVTVPELTSWETLQPHVVNDFEAVVNDRHPEVSTIIAQLRLAGASIAGMSGSGSTLFGVVPLFADTVRLTSELPGVVVPSRTVTRVSGVELVE